MELATQEPLKTTLYTLPAMAFFGRGVQSSDMIPFIAGYTSRSYYLRFCDPHYQNCHLSSVS